MGAPGGCKQHGLRGRKVLVGTGRAISIDFGINGVRKYPSGFVGPSFPAYMALFFQLRQVAISRET